MNTQLARVSAVAALSAGLLVAGGSTAHAGGTPQPSCAGEVATRVGTPHNDVLVGTPGRDVFAAGDGDDTVYGRGGDDVICGRGGADTLYGGPGDDRIFGGDGRVRGGDEVEYYHGNVIDGGAGDDVLHGGTASTSTQNEGSHPNVVTFRSATGPITIAAGSTVVVGRGVGRDRIDGFLRLTATRFDDRLATNHELLLFGGAGDDVLSSSGPRGFTGLYGGPGDDVASTLSPIGGYAYGGPGDDRLIGGPAGNSLSGGPGTDVITGAGGEDDVDGVSGADRVSLGVGDDEVFLDAVHAPPTIDAGPGHDTLRVLPERRSDILVDYDRDRLSIDGIETSVKGFEDFESYPQRAHLRVRSLVFLGSDVDEWAEIGSAVYHRLLVRTGAGDDSIWLENSRQSSRPRAFGGDGNDFLLGSDRGDYLDGEGGHDRLYAGGGHDTCVGESLHSCEVVLH